MIVVALVCILFLLHFRSAFVAIFTLPVGILASFLIMHALDINANIMSLGGIAIAIGVMVDASVVMVENAHKHLERARQSGEPFDRDEVIITAAKEVGPALFYSLVIITLSFLPVFTLQAQEGRLFRPLAFTKTFAMGGAAVLAITIIPVLMALLVRGKILPEHRNPLSRFFIWAYQPFIHFVLRYPKIVILTAAIVTVVTILPFQRLGSEFIPPLYEGDFLWMPTTDPGISITKSRELIQQTNKIIRQFPEVHHTFGKIGRAETSTDPAPLSMIETTIMLKPAEEWPQQEIERLLQRLAAAASGAQWAPSLLAGDRAGSHTGRAGSRDQRRDPVPGPDQRQHGRTNQDPARHADDRYPSARRHQDLRSGPGDPSGSRTGNRPGRRDAARDTVGLSGQVVWRQLPRLRDRPHRGIPIWPQRRRRAGRHHDGHRGHEHHPDRRGPRAVPRQRALQARVA